jgi:phenylalanyl-tRNA synthetase beta chain
LRVPLSWLRDFAPFEGEPAELAAVLDDLGLVVEGIESVGEGLGDVVVARVDEIAAIVDADRIRAVVVDDGTAPVEVVCGASNFAVGDLVALAPVGAVLPGGFAIKARKMKGAPSNGMLCSGRELELSDDHDGILRLNDVAGAAVGQALTEALGIEPDVIFDIAVEANRPDAWSMAGVARDLAARLGLPFAIPDVPGPSQVGASAHG